MSSTKKTVVIAAGGTGGHIFPGLAVAQVLEQRGYHVVWAGNPAAMEGKLVPKQGVAIYPVVFYGLRGNGLKSWLMMPFHLMRSAWQSWRLCRKYKPVAVLGMGGYVSFVPLLMAKLLRIPTLIHEQNALAGQVNRLAARFVSKVLTHFPNTLPREQVVGNPVRSVSEQIVMPQTRFANRSGALKLLVLGGSLGAKALNEMVPQALAKIQLEQRPIVRHQSGAAHLDALKHNYEKAGVSASCEAFIDNVLDAMLEADILICRAGATTVAEVAALGVAALFVPYPFAVDDHQTHNAQVLVKQSAAWLIQQRDLTVDGLVSFLNDLTRDELASRAEKAYQIGQRDAAQKVAEAVLSVADRKID